MGFDDYKVVLYRNQPDGWVAEIPAIAGCHALMPTAEEALTELAEVFLLIEEEHREHGRPMPRDTTEIVHA
jgi:predicted RNase H-like HicB family nuclease